MTNAPARHDAPLGHRPALDGLRALAIVPVMFAHSSYFTLLPGGWVGVDLFFVLSGFLITTLLLEEWEVRGDLDLRAFYLRRGLRLMPALLALLTGVALLSLVPALAEATVAEVGRFSLYVLSYSANWVVAANASHWPSLLGHLWSLAVEEQFYLAWPLLLYAMLRLRVRPRTMVIGLLFTIAALALWRSIVWHRTHDFFRVYFSTDCRASGLLAGSALGLVRRTGVRVGARWGAVLCIAGCAVYGWTITHADNQAALPFAGGLKLVEIASLLMIAAVAMAPATASFGPLQWRPFVWVGRRSYAMYLWHVPMLYAATHLLPWGAPATAAAGIALTALVTVVSWRVVEQPALRYKLRYHRRALIPIPQPA